MGCKRIKPLVVYIEVLGSVSDPIELGSLPGILILFESNQFVEQIVQNGVYHHTDEIGEAFVDFLAE